MQIDTVKKDLLDTLYLLKVKEFPVLIEEVLDFFISGNNPPVAHNLIAAKLKELEDQQLVYIDDEGFISLSKDVDNKVQERLKLEASTKEKAKYSKKVLSGLSGISFIRFIGAIGEPPFGLVAKSEKVNLILIVEKDTLYLSRFIVENYLKMKFAFRNFKIVNILETDNLKWNKNNPQEGLKLLNILTFINKDKTYESFIAANNWIFEFFSNYPLEKVSWGFRISKNIENKVSGIYSKLNNFLKPKAPEREIRI